MIRPDNLDDATMEYVARLIEEPDFLDLAGTLAKRKRAREDAQLRMSARHEMKAEIARHIRAMKSRPDLDARTVLEWIAEHAEKGIRAESDLRDAWPLAWKGWLNIYATVRCNSNSIPPETSYRIEITERGRSVLNGMCVDSEAAPDPHPTG